MGRAGSGGGGHGGGGHSSHRSGGGHRVSSSSSRSGSSLGHSRSRGSSTRINIYNGSRSYYPIGGYLYSSNPVTGIFKVLGGLFLVMFFMVILILLMAASSFEKNMVMNTTQRYKLENTYYENDVITDQIGWFDNEVKTEQKLKEFYNLTGVQPKIILKSYDPLLVTDLQKEEWAKNYYEENINNEHTFLYVYFAERNIDEDVGYMYYINGKQVESIMDAEAIEIFWKYIDRHWYSNMSTDDLFTTVYIDTAEMIMSPPYEGTNIIGNIVKGIFAIVIIIIIVIAIIVIRKQKRKHEKERAEETERILNTPIESIADKEAEDLTNKYL